MTILNECDGLMGVESGISLSTGSPSSNLSTLSTSPSSPTSLSGRSLSTESPLPNLLTSPLTLASALSLSSLTSSPLSLSSPLSPPLSPAPPLNVETEFDNSSRPSTQNMDEIVNMFRAEDIGIDDSLQREDVCFFCGLTPEGAQLKGLELRQCEHCQDVYSCSAAHYELHRPDNNCFPYLIKKSKKSGRYMIASRDIMPCELILSEKPAVVGPYARTSPGCLQCFKKVDDSYLCPDCNFSMCNEACASGPLHKDECKFFQERDYKPESWSQQASPSILSVDVHSILNRKMARNRASSNLVCITPLRMLLKKETDPKSFALINMLMDHENDGQCHTTNKQINLQLVNAALMLQEVSFKMDKFSHSDIQRMIGILRTNGMKMEPHGEKGIPGVVIYPIYCLINHACYNNTNYVKFPDLHLELRSQLLIKKGEQIYTRYVSSTIGNLRRREDIRRYWFFDCKCARCTDVTEFGTNMSAILCYSCKQGHLLPRDTLDYKSDWDCVTCSTSLKHETIDEVLTAIEHQVGTYGSSKRVRLGLRVPPIPKTQGPWAETVKEIAKCLRQRQCEKLIERETNSDSDVLEEMLYHFSKLLHPNHYILIDIMHNLVHVYAGKPVLSRPEKERKIQLCMTVLETLGKVDPGYTKWRGTLLQELIHPIMLISKEDHASGRITPREFQRRLAFCSKKLNQARKCLNDGFSPADGSPEKPDKTGKESIHRRLERRAKQKI